MKSFLSNIIFPVALVSSVLGHGYVSEVSIAGTSYKGNIPGATPNPSIIRQITTIDPVKGANNSDLNCGFGAQAAANVGNAMPGDQVQFYWGDGGGTLNWPHNTGPLMTYMASCGSTTCDKFDTTQAKWFKIDQQGQENNDGNGGATWYQNNVSEYRIPRSKVDLKANSPSVNGEPVNVTLPPTLAAGNYVVRHEIIALQLAVSLGGAEFYPSCTQITVGGSQTGGPTEDELVSFPGAYSDTDPGIYDPNVYNGGSTYTFPGPPVAAFAASSASNTNSTSSGSTGTGTASTASSTTSASGTGTTSTASGTTSASGATSTGSSSNSTCKLKKRAVASSNHYAVAAAASIRPRHVSRVMRGLIAGRRSSA
ncbi:hypothetical protein H0H92_003036 [Tricholoma furcatifolium]|nr:hypothetical protein H0H92_003036 [Tricholoma furcatifolium]